MAFAITNQNLSRNKIRTIKVPALQRFDHLMVLYPQIASIFKSIEIPLERTVTEDYETFSTNETSKPTTRQSSTSNDVTAVAKEPKHPRFAQKRVTRRGVHSYIPNYQDGEPTSLIKVKLGGIKSSDRLIQAKSADTQAQTILKDSVEQAIQSENKRHSDPELKTNAKKRLSGGVTVITHPVSSPSLSQTENNSADDKVTTAYVRVRRRNTGGSKKLSIKNRCGRTITRRERPATNEKPLFSDRIITNDLVNNALLISLTELSTRAKVKSPPIDPLKLCKDFIIEINRMALPGLIIDE